MWYTAYQLVKFLQISWCIQKLKSPEKNVGVIHKDVTSETLSYEFLGQILTVTRQQSFNPKMHNVLVFHVFYVRKHYKNGRLFS